MCLNVLKTRHGATERTWHSCKTVFDPEVEAAGVLPGAAPFAHSGGCAFKAGCHEGKRAADLKRRRHQTMQQSEGI